MNELHINEYKIIDDAEEKPYCVYIVDFRFNRRRNVIEKRYSQFHALHNELRRHHSTPYFPPKKVRSLQTKVLEKRRKALEVYMQTMLKLNQSRGQVLTFLGINKADEHLESENIRSREKRLNHQPVFQFKKGFNPQAMHKSTMPDIITEGVLLGLYKTT